jgi:dsDNA-specific endonuclease/ATPase MutS2
MAELLKRTEELKVYTEEEAQELINRAKLDPDNEGYELKQYKMVKKEKKSQGEVIDEWVIVTLVKQW